jgi:phytoene synthase
MSDPFIHCEALVREADKDRFITTLFAPSARRRPLYALYAFNVEVARVREAAHQPLPGEIRLQWWRDALAGEWGEANTNPVAAALLDTIVRYRLPPQMFVDLIDARAFDLYDTPMQTLAELETYAEKTASALMRLATLIVANGDAAPIEALVKHLGIAQAITGVLAALPFDAARGQLYVPIEVMQHHGAQPHDVYAGRASPALRAALADMRMHARRHLAQAKSLLPAVPDAIAPALLLAALVRPMLDRMEWRNDEPFKPTVLPQWRRQWILWRAARRGLVRAL